MNRLQRKTFRAIAFALFATPLLSACILGGGRQRDPVTIYAPDVRIAANADWPCVEWALAIAPATAPRMLDGTRIAVRPTPGELQVYRGAIWSQPAPQLLEDAVLHALEDSGRIRAVARQSSSARTDFKLALDVRRFEADYAGKDTPDAVIEVSAKLLSQRDQQVAAARTFVQRRASSGKSIGETAVAFDGALTAITADIAQWTLQSGK